MPKHHQIYVDSKIKYLILKIEKTSDCSGAQKKEGRGIIYMRLLQTYYFKYSIEDNTLEYQVEMKDNMLETYSNKATSHHMF